MRTEKTETMVNVDRQMGGTSVSRAVAWTLAILMLATITVVPVIQLSTLCQTSLESEAVPSRSRASHRSFGGHPRTLIQANRARLKAMNDFEDALEEHSWLRKALLPPVQRVLTRGLGVGNGRAIGGLGGWLFYEPNVQLVTGPGFLDRRQFRRRLAGGPEWERPPQPDPIRAILHFRHQLAERGIALIVMPTPVKPMIEPDHLGGRFVTHVPVANPSHGTFLTTLAENGVLVFDPVMLLTKRRAATGRSQYLMTDTHWTPDAMACTASNLAALIRAHIPLPPVPDPGYRVAEDAVTNSGDLAAMVVPDRPQDLLPPESVVVEQVITARDEVWQASRDADVLVLGDSFCNMYSLESLGWGFAAGFVEHLSLALGRPLDRLVRNDGGAYATREMIGRELARGHDRLAGKKVVIWQFAARELAFGDWLLFSLKLGAKQETGFYEPSPDGAELTGTVENVSGVPKPGRVPYKDFIMSIRLRDIEGQPASEALVYAWGMRDNRWTPAAYLRTGQQITLNVRDWEGVAGEYERLNRGEIDDDELLTATPCWGEMVE